MDDVLEIMRVRLVYIKRHYETSAPDVAAWTDEAYLHLLAMGEIVNNGKWATPESASRKVAVLTRKEGQA